MAGHPRYSAEEIGSRGRAIYEKAIRARVEPEHVGEFLVVDIETGDYEVGDDEREVCSRARARSAGGALYGLRIGARASGRIGFVPTVRAR